MANFAVTPVDTTFTVKVGENTLAAANSATAAASSAVLADTAADRSEAARDVAIAAGVQYPTEAAAVAAIADGAFASYLDADGNPVWGERDGSSMLPLPGPWIDADKIGTTGGGTVQDAVDVLSGRVIADDTSGNLIVGSPTSGDLLSNTTAGTKDGDINTFFGINTGLDATSAYACAFFGYGAGANVTTGHSNTLLAYQAGHNLTTGIMNTLVGLDAGFLSTAMNRSVIVGHHCVNLGVYSGEGLIVIGQQTARNLTGGDDHIVIGRNAQANSPATGSAGSVVIGSASALASSVSNSVVIGKDIVQSSGAGTRAITDSVLFGHRAMFGVRSSSNDCVIGQFAMFQNDGSAVDTARNTAYGGEAGFYVGGTNNAFFGYRCGAHSSITTLNGVVAIGYRAGDVAGGASALADNDFVIANAEIDSRRILWGNFATRVLNMGGVLNVAGRINADGGLKVAGIAPPANSSATGEVGEIRVDADFIYVCTAENTWKRVAIAAW